MNNFVVFLNCLCQTIGLVLNIYYIANGERFNKITYIKLFILIMLTDLLTFGSIEYLSLFFSIIVMFIFLCIANKKIIKNLLYIFISIITEFIILVLLWLILKSLFGGATSDLESNALYNVLMGLLYVASVYFLRKPTSKLGKKISSISNVRKGIGKIPFLLITNVSFIIVLMLILPLFKYMDYMYTYVCVIGVFIVSSVSSLFIYGHISAVERKKIVAEKELELTNKYQLSIEKMYEDIMNFKHDYLKIYSTFKIYIENKDIECLEEYFNNNITPLQGQIKVQDSNLKALTYIEDLALQGIIYTSILKAESLGIFINIDINDSVGPICMETIDLCRVVGIFLENAIEACEKTKNPTITIYISDEDEKTLIVIENTCESYIDINTIKNKSNKERGRGRGLLIARDITKKYENVIINTQVINGKFTQEIWITKMDRSFRKTPIHALAHSASF